MHLGVSAAVVPVPFLSLSVPLPPSGTCSGQGCPPQAQAQPIPSMGSPTCIDAVRHSDGLARLRGVETGARISLRESRGGVRACSGVTAGSRSSRQYQAVLLKRREAPPPWTPAKVELKHAVSPFCFSFLFSLPAGVSPSYVFGQGLQTAPPGRRLRTSQRHLLAA
ncbi:hypothetical protein GQ53DRAFT_746040 [Thozetella sp. PMI_491]|nr:hypothetical protein GQ53DRAFT_746040 [Thozetella sp. PMI_491]